MKLLEERIRRDGVVAPGNVLKVGSFLNHQMDVELYDLMGEEFYRLFKDSGVTKILTIEASGIGIACAAARYFKCPVLCAKKTESLNLPEDVYTSKVTSFTKRKTYTVTVAKDYLPSTDKVLIIDDFLALGNALFGLMDIVKQAGAETVGIGIAVEKAFQEGGDRIRATGIHLESLARVQSMSVENGVEFAED